MHNGLKQSSESISSIPGYLAIRLLIPREKKAKMGRKGKKKEKEKRGGRESKREKEREREREKTHQRFGKKRVNKETVLEDPMQTQGATTLSPDSFSPTPSTTRKIVIKTILKGKRQAGYCSLP